MSPAPMSPANPFRSLFLAGFECSTHRRKHDGARLDLIAATGHDVHARTDYARAAADGLRAARDGLRWHLIETSPGVYDWSSWLPMLDAAAAANVAVVWDLWHYGTPDHLDPFAPDFPDRFAAFAAAAARVHQGRVGTTPLWCPMNEISFFSQMAGEVGHFHPFVHARGHDLKRALVRAAVAASEAVLAVDPSARLLWAEPCVNPLPRTYEPADIADADGWRNAQYQVFDMICGRMDPDLGGRPALLDIVGANFYPHNQWVMGGGGSVPLGHHSWKPFSAMLGELADRYGRPILVAETGAEGSARASWAHYIAHEVGDAWAAGAEIIGLCLYPVIQYPGWDDDRHCETGLYGPADAAGRRDVHQPLLDEVHHQERRLAGPRRDTGPVGSAAPAGRAVVRKPFLLNA